MTMEAADLQKVAADYAEFPDLVVRCDDCRMAGRHVIFVWTLEGRHGRTRSFVKVGGWEEWDWTAP